MELLKTRRLVSSLSVALTTNMAKGGSHAGGVIRLCRGQVVAMVVE